MTLKIGYLKREIDGVSTGDKPKSITVDLAFAEKLRKKFTTKKYTFIMFVVIPSLFAGLYYFAIASGQYISEARMVVRTIGVSEQFDTSEKRDGRSIIGGDSLTQDSYIVANYLQSPQLVRILEERIKLRSLLARSNIDPLSRLSSNASFEGLHKFWLQHVDTYVDGPSGIIIFTVRAFSPSDANEITNAAMTAAEQMIDTISEKAKNDLVKRGEQDVMAALARYRDALNNLRDYQNKTGILDPLSSAKMTNAIISKLTEQKLEFTVNLNSLVAAGAADTARGRDLKRLIQALEEEITLRQNTVAGSKPIDGVQLSNSLTEFSRLETQRIVNQALYEATVRNLDTAKSTALKRTTFISVFSKSYLPEESRYPDRLSQWIIVAGGLLTLWITVTLIWMSIEDHRV